MKKFAKFLESSQLPPEVRSYRDPDILYHRFRCLLCTAREPVHVQYLPNKLGASAGAYWLGTTSMGQDVVWLLIEAIHNSLVIGLIVAFLGTVVGVFVGLLSGLPVAF